MTDYTEYHCPICDNIYWDLVRNEVYYTIAALPEGDFQLLREIRETSKLKCRKCGNVVAPRW